jgi:6-phosphogluconolactonase
MPYSLISTESNQEFITRAVEKLTASINKAIAKNGRCVLGLSGGSTPKPIYEELGKQNIDWDKVWLFLVDERAVPSGDSASNQELIWETILKNANIPKDQIIFPDTSLPLAECIEKYTTDLHELFRTGEPDILTLGLGEDGHIASLFPPLSNRVVKETATVLHTTTDRFEVHDRLTLSLNQILKAREYLFLIKGSHKHKTWKQMLKSHADENHWPAKPLLKKETTTIIARW